MITLLEYIESNTYFSKKDLDQIEKYLDAVFGKLGVDIEFSKHFHERLNDERNGKPISRKELIELFQKEYLKYGKTIVQMGPDKEAVLTDLSTNVNSPIVLNWNREKKVLELVAKTIMRKKDFKPNNSKEKHFKVK